MELTCRALTQTLVNLAIRPLNYIRLKLKPSLAVNVQRLVIATPFDPEAYPDFNYKAAYIELREVYDSDLVRRAMVFAAQSPEKVYGKESDEYTQAKNGYFDSFLYFSISRSTSSSERR